MRNVINFINLECPDVETLGCCCGHKKYPMTIVVRDKIEGRIFDLMSGKTIPRKKRFYRSDKKGNYYIPETVEGK